MNKELQKSYKNNVNYEYYTFACASLTHPEALQH